MAKKVLKPGDEVHKPREKELGIITAVREYSETTYDVFWQDGCAGFFYKPNQLVKTGRKFPELINWLEKGMLPNECTTEGENG